MPKPRTESHLVQYLRHSDIETVVGRIPESKRDRLRDVFLRNESRGVRRLGWVTTRGRRDIVICSVLPPRVSLRAYIYKGQSPQEFGAPTRGQWPPWAVRRYLLYDAFLHELGHLQLVDPKTSNWNRRYASETLAEEFADRWRRRLFREPFDHPDPIHFPPSEGEIKFLEVWERLNKPQRFQVVSLALRAPHNEPPNVEFLGDLSVTQHEFLGRVLNHDETPHTAGG